MHHLDAPVEGLFDDNGQAGRIGSFGKYRRSSRGVRSGLKSKNPNLKARIG
jgi:hypothetical protein